MMPNVKDCFMRTPSTIGLDETGQNKLLQVIIRYRLFEELASGEWVDCSGEGMEITGYHILEKRDDSLNENTIESLKAALGWDGRDPFWLQDNAEHLAQQPVQVKLAFEEYNGQQPLKVQFLNPVRRQGRRRAPGPTTICAARRQSPRAEVPRRGRRHARQPAQARGLRLQRPLAPPCAAEAGSAPAAAGEARHGHDGAGVG